MLIHLTIMSILALICLYDHWDAQGNSMSIALAKVLLFSLANEFAIAIIQAFSQMSKHQYLQIRMNNDYLKLLLLHFQYSSFVSSFYCETPHLSE